MHDPDHPEVPKLPEQLQNQLDTAGIEKVTIYLKPQWMDDFVVDVEFTTGKVFTSDPRVNKTYQRGIKGLGDVVNFISWCITEHTK